MYITKGGYVQYNDIYTKMVISTAPSDATYNRRDDKHDPQITYSRDLQYILSCIDDEQFGWDTSAEQN